MDGAGLNKQGEWEISLIVNNCGCMSLVFGFQKSWRIDFLDILIRGAG